MLRLKRLREALNGEYFVYKGSLTQAPCSEGVYILTPEAARALIDENTIGVVGKYIEHRDAYKSIYEALDHAGFAHSTRVIVKRIEAELLERQEAAAALAGCVTPEPERCVAVSDASTDS